LIRSIFYHVGKGDLSLVLLPNGESVLIDCYKADEAAEAALGVSDTVFDAIATQVLEHKAAYAEASPFQRRALMEEVLLERESKRRIRIHLLAVTHADRDHLQSRKRLRERFDIEWLADNGRDYSDPSAAQKDYLRFRSEMAKKGRYAPVKRAGSSLLRANGVDLLTLSPNRDIEPTEDNNNQCLILKLCYQGKALLFPGDSPVDDWVNDDYGILTVHPNAAASDILHVAHHGSRTFFTPPGPRPPGQPEYTKEEFDTTALEAIDPTVSFITCSGEENADHPHPIALELYEELTNTVVPPATRKSHVYLSHETSHTQIVIDDDGCIYKATANTNCRSSEEGPRSQIPYLMGTVRSRSGRLDPAGIWVVSGTAQVDVSFTVRAKGQWSGVPAFDWRVLNNGQANDRHHHEFYGMDSTDRRKKTFWSRPLVYTGLHLMQCLATAKDGREWATWCTGGVVSPFWGWKTRSISSDSPVRGRFPKSRSK